MPGVGSVCSGGRVGKTFPRCVTHHTLKRSEDFAVHGPPITHGPGFNLFPPAERQAKQKLVWCVSHVLAIHVKAQCYKAHCFVDGNSTLLYAQRMSEAVQVNFRMPRALKEQLEVAARESSRSLTAEIIYRLELTFGPGPEMDEELIALVMEKLNQFGERLDEIEAKRSEAD